jgi:hypothetical protein
MTSVSAQQDATEARAVRRSSKADPLPGPPESVSQEQRHLMIAEAAFFLAQARGFEVNHELSDWLAAEREIDKLLFNSNR